MIETLPWNGKHSTNTKIAVKLPRRVAVIILNSEVICYCDMELNLFLRLIGQKSKNSQVI